MSQWCGGAQVGASILQVRALRCSGAVMRRANRVQWHTYLRVVVLPSRWALNLRTATPPEHLLARHHAPMPPRCPLVHHHAAALPWRLLACYHTTLPGHILAQRHATGRLLVHNCTITLPPTCMPPCRRTARLPTYALRYHWGTYLCAATPPHRRGAYLCQGSSQLAYGHGGHPIPDFFLGGVIQGGGVKCREMG